MDNKSLADVFAELIDSGVKADDLIKLITDAADEKNKREEKEKARLERIDHLKYTLECDFCEYLIEIGLLKDEYKAVDNMAANFRNFLDALEEYGKKGNNGKVIFKITRGENKQEDEELNDKIKNLSHMFF